MPHLYTTSRHSKNFIVLPICLAITASMFVGCSSTPSSTPPRGAMTLPPVSIPQSNYPVQNPVQNSYPVNEIPPVAAQTPAIERPATASTPSLLDSEDLDELEDLLQATDMTMVEDNKLAIQQYGNLWNRLRAGYGVDQSQYSYNSRIEAQKNWFIPRQDYLNRLSARASRYLYHTVREAERRNIPTELALLPVIESSYDPTATSNASAAGLWQFIPSTGRIYGLNQTQTYDGRRDVIESTRAAYDFLTTLYNQFGSWELALAAYNAGPGRIQNAIDYNESRGLPTDFWSLNLPKETMSYVPRFLAVSQIVRNPEQYGVAFPAIANRQHFRSVPANNGASLADVSRITGVPQDELRMLNPALLSGTVDVAGPKRVVIPNDISLDVDAQITALSSAGLPVDYNTNTANNSLGYNNDPYNKGELSASSAGLAEYASNAKVPSQTTNYIEPVRSNEPPLNSAELQKIHSELIKTNTLPTTSAAVTSNSTIIQEPPLSKAERDFIANQIRQNAPQVQQVVSPVDGNIKLNAVQTQQSILQAKGVEKRLSFAAPAAAKPRPQGARSVYKVQRGDTLSTIAERAGLNWRDVAEWNQINPQANLMAGSSLYLYNARPMTTSNTASGSNNIGSNSNSAVMPTRYTVRSGDTLIGTANRFGLSTSQLASYNNLSTNSQLRTGQVLWLVPGKSSTATSSKVSSNATVSTTAPQVNYAGNTESYRVRSGDTLTGLARRYKVALSTLAGMNGLSIRETLTVGQRLTVPAPRGQSQATTVTSSTRPIYTGKTSNYTVKAGDSLFKLANDLKVSRDVIASLNSFDANAQLQRGQVIKLPASTEEVNVLVNKQAITYQIQSGDTLIGVANRYNISVNTLAAANNLATNAQLIRGRSLTIPAAGTQIGSRNTATTNTESGAPKIAQTTSYTVKSGDTLIGLAGRYGVSVATLAATNDLSTDTQLRIGQRLKVPSNAAGSTTSNNSTGRSTATNRANYTATYKVQSGDTLIGLANRYGVSVSDLAAANNLARNAQLRIGQRLNVPSVGNTRASNSRSPSTSSSTSARASNFEDTYKVASGDTLTGVAGRYGISVSQLASANNLSTSAGLQLGQRLKVPALTLTHTVKSGDTLIGLANHYGVTRQQIAALNNISTSAQLRIGQKLTIPR